MNAFLRWRNAAHEAWGLHSPPGMSPAPPADRAPGWRLGQATISLANRRASFFRSVDIKLLIIVDMPGWRLFVSLETAIEPGWSVPGLAVLPQQGGCGHGEQGTQRG